jgi:hypothetical protein
MKRYVELFENWQRNETIVLTSRQGRTITVIVTNGRIEEIDNEAGLRFPFFTGQPVTLFMKGWACNNGFKWNGEDPCDRGEEKIFGVKKKFVPKGHEWRQVFPHKFRGS